MENKNVNYNAVANEFINIKELVKTIIKNKDEVTPITKIKKSGVYMIYVDNFDDDKLIPIYIGKSNDIQRRYKDHYCEILSLNRLSFEEYKKYNDAGIYDGSFKSCKIFKYMIEHKCSLSDYHLIILESCPEEELESKEQYYINKFKSEYFGFNQLNLKTLFPAYIHHNKLNDLNLYKKYIEIFKTNCDGIIKYFNWGYTKFNYEYAFPTKTDISRISKDESRKMLCELISCIDSVNEYIDSPFYSRKNEISKVEDIIQQISERKKLSKEMRQILFPLNNFDIYSLKDRMYQQKFDNNYIRFVLSNNGKSKISDIIKIDYKLNGLYNEFYIGNKTTINSSMVEYGEKDIYNRDSMQFKRHFFNIIPKNFKFHIIKPRIETEAETARFISVVSEYKTGINDFTLYNKKFVGLDEAMLNIIEQIKPDTKINVMCSESKTLLTDLLTRELSIKTQNKIKKKILVFNLQI